jgi:hypothetical protein
MVSGRSHKPLLYASRVRVPLPQLNYLVQYIKMKQMKTVEDEEIQAPVDKWAKSLVFLTSITGSNPVGSTN